MSPLLGDCELTHAPRRPIDVGLAREQHRLYEEALGTAGMRVMRIDDAPEFPDGVFVEDLALVLPDAAVILRPGAPSRRGEAATVARALQPHRPLREIEAPGTVDGGDILRVGRTLYVGMSSRTNEEGVAQLAEIAGGSGFEVRPVRLRQCLHLKSAVTLVADNLLLANREWLIDFPFEDMQVIDVAPTEAGGANALRINDVVIYPAGYPATANRLRRLGLRIVPVEVSEIQKAEGGVTCCCLPLEVSGAGG